MTVKTTLLALLLLPAILPSRAAADEIQIQFGDLSYPIELPLPVPQKNGAVLRETPYSEPPSVPYDTVLLQGEMSDPGLRIELVVKGRSIFSADRYAYDAFNRFPNGRFWARYRVPTSLQPLKFRVIAAGAKSASSLVIYESELLLDTRGEEAPPAVSTVPYVPDAALFYPENGPFPLIRRAAWNAAPPKEAYTPHEPVYFTLHHTQGNYPLTPQGARNEVMFIQDYHQNAKNWIDIGYHFLVDPLGNIYEGRPIKVLGAHVSGRNTGNIGISVLGNYHKPAHNVFTDASRDSFVTVGRYLKDSYEVPVSSFYAHRDIGNSDCPGDDLYAKKELLRGLIFTPQPTLPVQVPQSAGGLPAAQSRALRQLLQYIDSPR